MSSNRDDFSRPTIRKLRDRVAHRCSNPSCRVPTSAPGQNVSQVINIGVAAHIHAASPEGPRYSPEMSSEERKAFENGIWLCSNCSIKIDRSPSDYPSTLLKSWKVISESKTTEELGKEPPTHEGSMNLLTAALTGQPVDMLSTSINNIHKSVSNTLEKLDDRFYIKSEYLQGSSRFIIRPKKNDFSVHFKLNSNNSDLLEKYSAMVESGEEFSIPADSIVDVDSRLLEHLIGNTDEIKIGRKGVFANSVMWLEEPSSKTIDSTINIDGEIKFGTKYILFEGCMFDKIIKKKISFQIEKMNGALNLETDFSVWNNLEASSLPYLDKIYNLFSKMKDGWILNTDLEIKGEVIISCRTNELFDSQFVENSLYYISYYRALKVISRAMNTAIKINTDVGVSGGDAEKTMIAADIFSSPDGVKRINASEINGAQKITIEVTRDEDIKAIIDMVGHQNMITTQEENAFINIFGKVQKLPSLENRFINCLVEASKTVNDIVIGDTITLNLTPGDDFMLEREFMGNTSPQDIK